MSHVRAGDYSYYQRLGSPKDSTLGELVSNVGDKVHYIYDLGDHWEHVIELEEVLEGSDAHGKCLIVDGAMRCPAEDTHGCQAYQEQILNDYLTLLEDPYNDEVAREHASACFEGRHALNVKGSFRPAEFSLKERQEEIQKAFWSKASAVEGVKLFTNAPSLLALERVNPGPGQRILRTKYEDERFQHMGGYATAQEMINIKPDDNREATCVCGNPLGLQFCSRCKSIQYCSRECIKKDWRPHHKQNCPIEKANRAKSVKVEATDWEAHRPSGTEMNQEGSMVRYKKWSEPLRFKVGAKVECSVSQSEYAKGEVVQAPYRHVDGTIHPYQLRIDLRTCSPSVIPRGMEPLIFADWDDDVQVRKLPRRRR